MYPDEAEIETRDDLSESQQDVEMGSLHVGRNSEDEMVFTLCSNFSDLIVQVS